ncbi:PcfJ domain-containing protein [Desulfosediminicola flagellatus]|uniref:PcfJ domain-containing protein n=1 Tax=Desulfosediminicola flagellatus TaxID=2569541 RepID=UPI0010ADA386|nr:PcfJ domain-containing protein [Desulfosediminicola flagellatus]
MLLQARVNELNRLFTDDLANGTEKKITGKWDCKLPETIIGDYFIIPLTSSKLLKSEAYWMSNCCSSYTRSCADLEYCIFSIRSRSGERLATLGLISDQGYWHFDQCYGPANSEVLEESLETIDDEGGPHTEYWATELYYIAHEVVRLMNSEGDCH